MAGGDEACLELGGERADRLLTRNRLTHAVGKALPAHRGTVHALSSRRRASPGLDVASVTYDYDGAFACGSDDDLVGADVGFVLRAEPPTISDLPTPRELTRVRG